MSHREHIRYGRYNSRVSNKEEVVLGQDASIDVSGGTDGLMGCIGRSKGYRSCDGIKNRKGESVYDSESKRHGSCQKME